MPRSRSNDAVAGGLLIAVGLGVVNPVHAADEPPSLAEIVVTAQKREQNLQDVPLSISAVGGDQLANQGVFDLSRLDALVPGMKFGQSGADARPAIRGTRTQQVIGNADPVVAYYTDGIYRSRPGQALSTFVDVARVEVLRGPQGTLFGRNSFGGAVNVISNQPDPTGLHAGADLTVQNYQGVRAEGFVNLPINDANALRIAGYTAKQNGWVTNTANEQNSLHDLDDQFVRAQYLFRPSDDISLKLRVEYWHGGGNGPGDFGYYVPGVPVDPQTGKTNGVSGVIRPYLNVDPTGFYQGGVPGLNVPTPADPDPQHIARSFPSKRRVNQATYGAEFVAGLGFADFKAIVSDTQYQEYRQDDASFAAQPLWYNYNRVTAKTYTEELQLISKSSNPLSWVVGAYLLQDKPTDFYAFGTSGFAPPQGTVTYAPQLFAPAFGVPDPYAVDPNLYIQGPYRLETKANAVYADLTWSVIDTLRLVGGARYTHDKKTGEYDNPNYIIDATPPTHAEKTYSKTTWRGGVQFDLAPKSMLYALASSGFQSGGFNGNPSLTPYDQTTVKAYEIGWKNVLLEGRLRANLAVYDNKYTNLLSQKLITVGNAIQSVATNAGEVRARGAELELDWYPLEGVYLGARTSYNHSRFGNFIANNSFSEGGTAIGGSSIFQLNGRQVPLNPNATVSLIGSYDLPLAPIGIFTPMATVFHSTSYRTSDQPYFFANQSGYTTFDLSVHWRADADSHVTAELFCENCGNELILLRSTPNSGSVIYQDFAPPRMFGGRVSYRY